MPEELVGDDLQVLHAAPALLWHSRGGLARSVFSDRWLQFTGRALEEEQGDGWLQGVHPDDVETLREAVLTAEREGRSYEHEYRLRSADGHYRWVLEQGEPIVPGDPGSGFSGVCIDITERQRQESDRLLRAGVLERIGPAVMATDAEGQLTQWNARAEEIYGWSADEVLGTNLLQVNMPSLEVSQGEEVFASLREGRTWTGETVVRRRDDSLFLARGTVAPVYDDDGAFVGAVGVSEDVTEWLHSHGPTARFGRLLDRSPYEIHIYEAETLRFVQVNHGAVENLGYTEAELLGLSPMDVKREFDRESFEQLLEPLRAGETDLVSFETTQTRKDGSVYPVEVRVSLSHSEVPPVFVAIVEDITERRTLEQELQRANAAQQEALKELADGRQQLNDLVQNIPGVVWEARGQIGTPDYHVTFVSDQIEEILGNALKDVYEARNEAVFSAMHEDDRERVYNAALEMYADGEPRSVRFRWIATDGRAIWIDSYFCAIKDGDGKVVGLRGVNLVVDRQQRSEELLNFAIEAGRVLSSSLDYEFTLRSVAWLAVPTIADWCAVHLLDDDGVLQPVSVAHIDQEKVELVRQMQGRSQRLSTTPPYGSARVTQTGESQLVPRVTESMVQAAVSSDDARAAVYKLGLRSFMCVPIKLGESVLGAVSFATAESGHRFDEADLQAAEHLGQRAGAAIHNAKLYARAERERARFVAIVGWLDHALCQVDHEGRVEHINPAGAHLLGRQASDLYGEVLHDVVHSGLGEDEACPGPQCPLNEVLRSVHSHRSDTTFACADGSRVPVRINCSPVVVAGQTVGAIIAFEDITERLEADQRKDNFLAFAAHELRNPLTPISGLSRWLERRVKEGEFDPDIVEVAETLNAESKRMRNIVDVFLDLSRIESDRLVLDPTPMDLRGLVMQCAEEVNLRDRNVTTEIDVPDGDYTIVSDEGRIQQVLANLLDNAAKYSGDEPRVTITLRESAGQALITVRDEGPGIPEEERARIFDRFYRSATSSKEKGFGVGLYLAKAIVEQLGGTITCSSQPGKGTEFQILLPHRMPMADDGDEV